MPNLSRLFSCYFTFIPTHPLLLATLFLIAGISWQSWLQHSWFVAGVVVLTLTTTLSLCTQKTRYLLFFATFTLGGLVYQKQIADHDVFFHSISSQKTTCIATIIAEESDIFNPRIKQTLLVRLEKIYTDIPTPGNWRRVNTRLQLQLARQADVHTGDTIAITEIPIKKTSHDSFNFYLIKEGIATAVFLPKLPYILIARPRFSIRRIVWNLKTDMLYRIKEKLSPKTFALFSSIFLGNRHIVKKEMDTIKEYYKTWGISHHLARAGLHLIIFITLWGLLLNLAPLPLLYKQLGLLIICTIYLFLSWTSIPFIRAFFTLVLYKLCTISKVSTNTVHALTIVTFFTLLTNPAQLFFLDFQLSFGITGALAWFNLILQTQKRVLGKNC